MKELIWYSMPGALLMTAIAIVWPESIDTDGKRLVFAALIPLVGFAVHQAFRTAFEATGGYERKSRKVLGTIVATLAPTAGRVLSSRHQAFLVWETSFYSDDFPAPFREHDRDAWHFILSFWGMALAGFTGTLVFLGAYFFQATHHRLLVAALIEFAIAGMFTAKGWLTYRSLVAQEEAVAQQSPDVFSAALSKAGSATP